VLPRCLSRCLSLPNQDRKQPNRFPDGLGEMARIFAAFYRNAVDVLNCREAVSPTLNP